MKQIDCLQGDQGQWEGTQNLGSCFGLEWRRLYDLPFSETEYLKNPLNEDKPVKISRDGQELPPDIGQDLIRLFEEGAEKAGVPRPGSDVHASLYACMSSLMVHNSLKSPSAPCKPPVHARLSQHPAESLYRSHDEYDF